MDRTCLTLAEFSYDMQRAPLPAGHFDDAVTRLADSIGCALGGRRSGVASSARSVCPRIMPGDAHESMISSVIGEPWQTVSEMASFANCVMLRYLDFNDTFLIVSGGHPSDTIAPVMACAEAIGAPGERMLRGMLVAYEVYGALGSTIAFRARGWDQGLMVGIAVALGVGCVMELSRDELADAAAIAACTGVPPLATRRGALSAWKGCATALSGKVGLFSACLARSGISGPPGAFEGRDGLWERVTGTFDLDFSGFEDRPWISRSAIKSYPAVYHSQSAIEATLQVVEEGDIDPAAVAGVNVSTNALGHDAAGSDPEKWAPKTRETADHSIAFCVASALLDRQMTPGTYAAERLSSATVRDLMSRVTVENGPEWAESDPHWAPATVTITARSGERWRASVECPTGHPDRPMDRESLRRKFMQLAGSAETKLSPEALWQRVEGIRQEDRVDRFMSSLVA